MQTAGDERDDRVSRREHADSTNEGNNTYDECEDNRNDDESPSRDGAGNSPKHLFLESRSTYSAGRTGRGGQIEFPFQILVRRSRVFPGMSR